METTSAQSPRTAEPSREPPASRLRPAGEGLWTVHHTEFSVGGLHLGTRTTVVRLPDNSLWVHSPGPADAELFEQLRSLGPVSTLVAPNNLHHLFLKDYAAQFPEARVLVSEGAMQKVEVARATKLAEAPLHEWDGVMDQVSVAGIPAIGETAFFHSSTGTLILADLCFNVREAPWFTRTVMRLNGGWERFGATRLMRSAMKDRDAVRRSVDRILDWPIERISVCHGERIEQDGREVFRNAFEFLSPH